MFLVWWWASALKAGIKLMANVLSDYSTAKPLDMGGMNLSGHRRSFLCEFDIVCLGVLPLFVAV